MSSLRVSSSLIVAALLAGCNRGADATAYRPSMTMLRIGEVVVEEPPVIPEDNYIPGIVVAAEQYAYPDESGLRLAPHLSTALTDFTAADTLDDPTMLEKHAPTYAYSLLPGSMIDESQEQAIVYDDVRQGAIANCYMVAALTGVVYADRLGDVTNGMIREINDADGTFRHYAVRFYDAWGEPQDVTVDAELVRRDGKPLYARSADSRSGEEELWVGLVEKAYASWHGSYEKIGNGGYTGDVMQALTGATANYRNLQYQSDASLYASIVDAVNDGRPIASGTFGEDSGVDYEGTGVYAWHAYTVLGAEQTAEGTYRVQLRNPWGSSEPADNGPDDGIFWLDFGDWRRLYSNITIGGKFEADRVAPADVTDLALVQVIDDRALLGFTSTGDDATAGLANAYDVRVSDQRIDDTNFYEADVVQVGDPQSPGTRESFEVPGLTPGSTRYVALRVVDESGNASPISNVVEITVEGTPPLQGDLFFEFEDDADLWTPTGLFHLTSIESSSGLYSFYLGQDDSLDFDTGARVTGTLTSPVLDLAGLLSPEVLWEQILDVEEGEYDAAWLEVSTDGFATYDVVWVKGLTGSAWRLEWASLSAYEGRQVQIRFQFDSSDGVNNTGLGWFVDNVWVDGF